MRVPKTWQLLHVASSLGQANRLVLRSAGSFLTFGALGGGGSCETRISTFHCSTVLNLLLRHGQRLNFGKVNESGLGVWRSVRLTFNPTAS